MSYPIPEIIIESIIRDGFKMFRETPDAIIKDVFGFLLDDAIYDKYGDSELKKIKKVFGKKQVPIHHATHLAAAQELAVSIEFLSDAPQQEFLDDFIGQEDEDETAEIIATSISIDNYDSLSGVLYIEDASDISAVAKNEILVDIDGDEFTIFGVLNETGNKQIHISPLSEINISGLASVKSPIDYKLSHVRGRNQHITCMIVAHAKDPLTCKYLYSLIKYFLDYKGLELAQLGIINASYKGMNYQQDPNYAGDFSYMKALQLDGMIEENWSTDLSKIPYKLEVQLNVPKDVVTTEEANRVDQTVQIQEDEED
jgi:hypothetical protein